MMPNGYNDDEERKHFYLSNQIASDGQKTAYYFELPHKHCSCWVCYIIWQDGLEYSDIGDKINYCIDVIIKEAKLEDRLVKQTFYHMLSAYTNNPLNMAINSPSGEGKNYVLRKVEENFPKEDVMFLTGMTDKAFS